MNPILKYLNNFFAAKRILGENTQLAGLAEVDALLSALVDERKLPGLSITVLKEGKAVLQKGYGYADLEKRTRIEPQATIFRIASVSKPIAATALAHMVTEGKIALDASFYHYVPYYPKKKWDFTIRQLAGHTAGIRGYQGMEYGLNKPLSIKEGIEIFKDDALLFEPGTDYFYNSFDWVLISLAIQEASGMPFEAYVHEKVLAPLGMTATFAENGLLSTHGQHESQNAHMANFYSKNHLGFRDAIAVNNYFKLAGGGYVSTSADVAKFGQALLEGKLFPNAMQNEFLAAQTVNLQSTFYGLGWQVSQDRQGRPFYGHVGNGVGGYANFFVYPDQQTVIAILINCTDPKVQAELDEVIDALILASTKPFSYYS